jgi:hypothetical protein
MDVTGGGRMTCRMMLAAGLFAAMPLTGARAHPWTPQDTTSRKAKGSDAGTKAKKEKKPEETDPAKRASADSAKAVARAAKALARPLFASRERIDFTLTANFGKLMKDRDTTSKTRYPGTLVVKDAAGVSQTIPVVLRTRGHFRLMARNCRFVPIRVEFPDSGLKGTPFAGQKSLKLGTHCQPDSRYEQYTMKEYLAYRILNTITDRSYRARIARGTYVDSASGKEIDTRTALWLESDDDVADRLGGKNKEIRKALFDDVDNESLLVTAVFEYAIGNTDWSIYALHNVRMVSTDDGRLLPVPYDFDFSGFVHAKYATPDPHLPIKDVRDRMYRGPCRTLEEMMPVVRRFTEKKDAIFALWQEVPEIDGGEARDYLNDFFKSVADERSAKRAVVEDCVNKPGV